MYKSRWRCYTQGHFVTLVLIHAAHRHKLRARLAGQTHVTQMKALLWRQSSTTCTNSGICAGWTMLTGATHICKHEPIPDWIAAMHALPGITTVCILVNSMGRTKGMNKWCVDILRPPRSYIGIATWSSSKHTDNNVTFEARCSTPEAATNACNLRSDVFSGPDASAFS